MKAYSTDLRERVVAACDAGGATREQVAERFAVSVPWIRKLLRQQRETGSIAPRPRGGRAPLADRHNHPDAGSRRVPLGTPSMVCTWATQSVAPRQTSQGSEASPSPSGKSFSRSSPNQY